MIKNKTIKSKIKTVQSQMKRRSLALEDVEGLELDPNLEEPLKAKARRENSQDKGSKNFILLVTICVES